ncbi:hypothetical protein FGO68_gene2165 [Halteria grandinella]|uniref:Uncharacterized protein n=1 Tax=Halteria grandinella TaxID=5974 RepID=A0A8J8NKL6_HALGN|nr:hypothetical protein FGO68_gene2165 [Halteria grandinella]
MTYQTLIKHLKEECENLLFNCPLKCNYLVTKMSKQAHYSLNLDRSIVLKHQMCPKFEVACNSCLENFSEDNNLEHGCAKRWEKVALALNEQINEIQRDLSNKNIELINLKNTYLPLKIQETIPCSQSAIELSSFPSEYCSQSQYGGGYNIANRYDQYYYEQEDIRERRELLMECLGTYDDPNYLSEVSEID